MKRILPILAAGVLAAAAAHAQSVRGVLPDPALAQNAGDAVNAFPWGASASDWPGLRVLSTYAWQFDWEPVRITHLRWRPDDFVAPVSGGTFASATIRMSTSPRGWSNVNLDFASNHGADLSTAYVGPVVYTPTPGWNAWTPDSWCVEIELQQPFVYDPQQGDLVIDVDYLGTSFTGGELGAMDMQGAGAWASRVYASGNYPAPRAVNVGYAPVIGVTYQLAQADVRTFRNGCAPVGRSHDNFMWHTSAASIANSRPHLTMVGDAEGYRVDARVGTWRSTNGAVPLDIARHQEITVPLQSGFLFDGNYGRTQALSISSFGSVSTGPNGRPSQRDLLNSPHASWFVWHDYETQAFGGGSVMWEETATHVYVTWDGVHNASAIGGGVGHSFQFQFQKGTADVRLVWGAVPDRNGQSDYVVGYADGGQSWGANWIDLIAASQNGFRTSFADRFPLEHTLPMRPVLGRTITFTENNLPNTSSIGAVRISSRTYPNVITIDGMPGCQLWVPDDFSLPFVAHAGSSFVPLPLPAEPRYSGAWLYTQSVLLAPGANAVGVLLSNRLDLRVGVF